MELDKEYGSSIGMIFVKNPKEPDDFAGDKAGVGRYILGFLIASFFGLLAVHWARYYGWRGIWISFALITFGFALVLL